MKVHVQSGDTLFSLTRKALAGPTGAGSVPPFKELMAVVQKVAQTNDIRNPDLIFPGQVIDFSSISETRSVARSAAPEAQAPQVTQAETAPTALSAVGDVAGTSSPHRLLERMLDRAVARGYVPQEDQAEVRRRILDMAKTHRFLPDDFARVALMESDGLNPKATNGHCHGIIQFCDGPDRGAASVGYGRNPQKILGLSALKQLDLVDQYFEDTGVSYFRPNSLDNLYLSVLHPASRDERQLHKPLPIPGPQASALHVGGNQAAPITRASIRKGLMDHAASRLNSTPVWTAGGKTLPQSAGTWFASRQVSLNLESTR